MSFAPFLDLLSSDEAVARMLEYVDNANIVDMAAVPGRTHF